MFLQFTSLEIRALRIKGSLTNNLEAKTFVHSFPPTKYQLLFMESINKFVKSIKDGETISILPTVQSEARKDNYSICPSINVTNYSNVEDLGDYIWSKMQLLLKDYYITKEVVIYFFYKNWLSKDDFNKGNEIKKDLKFNMAVNFLNEVVKNKLKEIGGTSVKDRKLELIIVLIWLILLMEW